MKDCELDICNNPAFAVIEIVDPKFIDSKARVTYTCFSCLPQAAQGLHVALRLLHMAPPK